MGIASIYTRPTESESYEDPEDQESGAGGSQQSSDSSDRGFELPSGYHSGSSPGKKSSLSKSRSSTSMSVQMTGINDEDRLLMLAKHPNVTEEQVVATLFHQKQIKAARDQEREEQSSQVNGQIVQHHQVRFVPAFPVDADTGEAWERDPKPGRGNASTGDLTNAPETSFDQAWASDFDPEQYTPQKQSVLLKFWRNIFPLNSNDGAAKERDDSIVVKQDANLSISMASDKTPKISNVDEKARAKRIRQQTGYLTFGDRWERFQQQLLHTNKGRLVLGLLILLLLAIVATVVAAIASRSKTASVDSNQRVDRAGTGIAMPRPNFEWTQSPTSSPTVMNAFSTSAPSFLLQTESPIANTLNPTPVPTTLSPTANPTVTPTRRPTTLSPTEPNATRNPTRSNPTLPPTASPTTPQPTLSPSVAPTASPTTFLGSPALTELGASLVGSKLDQRFGQAVSLSGDGRVLAIGSPIANLSSTLLQAGMVQVFEWSEDANGGAWQPRGPPILGRNAGDQFGSAVALSADGSILAASEPNYDGPAGARSGNVRAFVYANGTNNVGNYTLLSQELSGTVAAGNFGISLSLSADGKRLAVGAPYHDNGGTWRNMSGQAVVFDYSLSATSGGTWQVQATKAGTAQLDWFGWSVDLDRTGNVLCVGAPRNIEFGGYVKCFDLTTGQTMGQMIQNNISPIRYDDNFGYAVRVEATNSSGSETFRLAIGAPGKNYEALDSGMVVVYEWESSAKVWSLLGNPIVADTPQPNDQLGYSVDFQENILIAGSPGKAKVNRYVLQGSIWERHPSSLSGVAGSVFGYAIQQGGDRLAVGSPGARNNTGMVNVFQP